MGSLRSDGTTCKLRPSLQRNRERALQWEVILKSQDIIIIDLGNKADKEAMLYPGPVINSCGRHFASLSLHFSHLSNRDVNTFPPYITRL